MCMYTGTPFRAQTASDHACGRHPLPAHEPEERCRSCWFRLLRIEGGGVNWRSQSLTMPGMVCLYIYIYIIMYIHVYVHIVHMYMYMYRYMYIYGHVPSKGVR